MPPAGLPRDQAALDNLVTHLEATIDKAALASPVLRRPAMHRLNRAEYGNAIRDLLHLDIDVASLLPPDEEAFGFDNNALVLNIPPALMERYLSAAWKISSLAVASPKITPSLETFRVRGDLSQHDHVSGLPIGTRGGIAIRHYFPVDGEYVISPRLYRETVNIIRGLELPHDLEVTLDGERVVLARFGGPKDEQANYLQPTLAGDEMEKRFQKRIAGESRSPSGRRRLHQEELGDDAGAAAAVRARAARPDYSRRHPGAGQGHHRGTVQRGRHGNPRRAATGSSSVARRRPAGLAGSQRRRMRPDDSLDAGAPRLSWRRERRRDDAARRLLREGARPAAAASTPASRARSPSCW